MGRVRQAWRQLRFLGEAGGSDTSRHRDRSPRCGKARNSQIPKTLRSVFIWDRAEKDTHEYKGIPYLEVRHTAVPVFYLLRFDEWLFSSVKRSSVGRSSGISPAKTEVHGSAEFRLARR